MDSHKTRGRKLWFNSDVFGCQWQMAELKWLILTVSLKRFRISMENWWNGSERKSVCHARLMTWIRSLKPIVEKESWFPKGVLWFQHIYYGTGHKNTHTYTHTYKKKFFKKFKKKHEKKNLGKMRELIYLVNWMRNPLWMCRAPSYWLGFHTEWSELKPVTILLLPWVWMKCYQLLPILPPMPSLLIMDCSSSGK